MDLGIRGQTALVTGSTAGIGFAVATLLAREGTTVIINGRTEERVASAKKQIIAAVPGARVEGVAADIASATGAAQIIKAFPQVDILVNNAGLFFPADFAAQSDAEWLMSFNINLMSAIRMARHYLPGMLARNKGRVVMVSSESGICPSPMAIHYSTMKAALLGLSRGLAEMTRGKAVTVNTVLPGPTASEGFSGAMNHVASARGMDLAALEREFFSVVRPASLLSRFATSDEVASMIVYLCGAQASATNGAALRVEGGIIPTTV